MLIVLHAGSLAPITVSPPGLAHSLTAAILQGQLPGSFRAWEQNVVIC